MNKDTNEEMRLALPQKMMLHDGWQFRQVGTEVWYQAKVPGCNFTDLLNNGLIDNPFYGDEEHRLQWVEHQDWEYRLQFQVDAELLTYDDLQLMFDGLDTYCDVFLNGHLLLQTNNMFVREQVSCKDYLVEGDNNLHLTFKSPITTTMGHYQKNGFTYPAENDKSIERLSVYSRKAPYHFGWDWGPRFVTSGIWRDVSLLPVNTAKIVDTLVQQRHSSDNVTLDIDVTIQGSVDRVLSAQVYVVDANGKQCAQQSVDVVDSAGSLSLTIEDPQLWWPVGMGNAYLYTLHITVFDGDVSVDNTELQIGLRTIELINRPDEMGESFYFLINNKPIFIKGANYIPSDSFLPEVDASRYQKIFADTVAANMNMLRVWGGGVYEDDQFYQLADQHGVLIWQDFMFACSLYPANQSFLDSIAREAEDNIKRLRNHPCIALWCGNNEIEMGIECWEWPEKFDYPKAQYEQLKADYELLFKNHLPDLVARFAGGTDYMSSSPISFWEHPEDDNKGDNHYWGVWHGELPFSTFKDRVPRFMSEYGFQSFPMITSIAQFSHQSDWHLQSDTMQTHQKHPRGNGIIQRHMLEEFNQPVDFSHFVYLSQLIQAQALRVAFSAHRGAKPFCMGTLYWQFNDCWPVTSWSGIDYYGRWKALHYQAKRSFQPVIVFVDEQEDTLTVKLVSDQLTPINLELDIQLMDFSGKQHFQRNLTHSLKADSSEAVISFNRADFLQNKDEKSLVLVVNCFADDQLVDRAIQHFCAQKQLHLKPPKLDVQISKVDSRITVQVTADTLVKHLHLQLGDSCENFTDNFFDLLPNESKSLTIEDAVYAEMDVEQLRSALTLTSLIDTYTASEAK